MTDEESTRAHQPPGPNGGEEDDGAAESWIKGALGKEAGAPVDVLPGVQRKLRERSGGKFYADGWSTAKQPPTLTFLVTSAIMLVVVAVAYAVLAPLRGTPESVRTEPAPVNIIPPPAR